MNDQASPRRRGRPPAVDSEDTRRSIIDAARRQFAMVGFHGTSLSSVAAAAGLTPSALYHYYDDKESLYEAVMRETVELVWSGLLERVRASATVAEQVEEFIGAANEYAGDDRLLSAFLVAVPVEARRHPPFAPLVELRTKWEDAVFDEIAATGLRTGELERLGDQSTASQAVRMVIMGWSFETHYQPQYRQIRADVARHLIGVLSR